MCLTEHQAQELWAPLKWQTQKPWVWLHSEPISLESGSWPNCCGPGFATRPKELGSTPATLKQLESDMPFEIQVNNNKKIDFILQIKYMFFHNNKINFKFNNMNEFNNIKLI